MAHTVFAVAMALGYLAFSLPAAGADAAAWCAVISRVASIGIANIARWKIAGLMSWEAIAGGVVRIRMSSLCRQNLKAQGNVALPRNRHPFLALSGCCPHQRCPLSGVKADMALTCRSSLERRRNFI